MKVNDSDLKRIFGLDRAAFTYLIQRRGFPRRVGGRWEWGEVLAWALEADGPTMTKWRERRPEGGYPAEREWVSLEQAAIRYGIPLSRMRSWSVRDDWPGFDLDEGANVLIYMADEIDQWMKTVGPTLPTYWRDQTEVETTTLRGIARTYGMSVGAVQEWARREGFPRPISRAQRRGQSSIYRQADVDAWVAEHRPSLTEGLSGA